MCVMLLLLLLLMAAAALSEGLDVVVLINSSEVNASVFQLGMKGYEVRGFVSDYEAVPQPCPPGYFCPQGTTSPVPCPQGTFWPWTSASNAGNCTACPLAGYCLPGSVSPTPCEAGTYSPTRGASTCLVCPEGYFCPFNSSGPVSCPQGTTQDRKGQTNVTSCIAPPAVLVCKAGTYPNSDACAPCPLGTFCNNGSAPACCPAGTFASSLGASACTLCTKGSTCAACAQSPVACDAGTYESRGLCVRCAVGSYSSEAGRTAPCPPCPANYACLAPDLILPCPANTASNASSSSMLQCQCVPGYSCTYTKRLIARVTLEQVPQEQLGNESFLLPFKQAVADACGVNATSVVIQSVLHVRKAQQVASLQVVVEDATAMGDLAPALLGRGLAPPSRVEVREAHQILAVPLPIYSSAAAAAA